MTFTVVGASGFIGSALVSRLEATGERVFAPARGEAELFTRPLGHVVYAAGVTSDFRQRPFDTLRANTVLLADLLEKADFESLLYLSSARIYRHSASTSEAAAILLHADGIEDLYDLTKMTAEALCRAGGRPGVRVVRLSNVVGSDLRSANFIYDLIRSACDSGEMRLRSALASEKDYVHLDDVLDLLPRIASSGIHACYNLGSGQNLSHAAIVGAIVAHCGSRLSVAPDALVAASLPLDIARVRNEFDYSARTVLDYIPVLLDEYRQQRK